MPSAQEALQTSSRKRMGFDPRHLFSRPRKMHTDSLVFHVSLTLTKAGTATAIADPLTKPPSPEHEYSHDLQGVPTWSGIITFSPLLTKARLQVDSRAETLP